MKFTFNSVSSFYNLVFFSVCLVKIESDTRKTRLQSIHPSGNTAGWSHLLLLRFPPEHRNSSSKDTGIAFTSVNYLSVLT
jgi:hypothetical protein